MFKELKNDEIMTAIFFWAYFHKIWGISHLKNTLCSLFVEYCKNLQGIECCWKACPWECQGWKSGFLETQILNKNRKNAVFMHIIPQDSLLTTQMHFSPTHLVPLLLSTLFGGLASKLSLKISKTSFSSSRETFSFLKNQLHLKLPTA